jgi:hypothetical protein
MRPQFLARVALVIAVLPGCRSLCHQYTDGPSPDPGHVRLGAGFVIFSSYGYDQAELTAGPGATLDLSILLAEYGPGVRRKPGDRYGVFRSELALDLVCARTFHDVRNVGGWAHIATTALGVRLSTPRLIEPRLNFTTGLTFARLAYENPLKPNARANGAYVGTGLETFITPEFSAGFEYTIHHVSGQDSAGAAVGDWYDYLRLYIATHF